MPKLTKSNRLKTDATPLLAFEPEENSATDIPLELRHWSRGDYVIGFDEAGRGPLAGPVCVALVCFTKEALHKIHQKTLLIGLGDSKKVNPKLREKLFDEIICLARYYQIQMVSSSYIDKFNINQAIFYGIKKSLEKLKLKKPFLILDGNYKLESNLLSWKHPEYISIPKADTKVASVAAASILAKVYRDRYMKKMGEKYPGYGLENHKGYGSKSHIEKIESSGLTKIHRKSFTKKFTSGIL
ncbi:MAG: ribonuclease HII [Leptospira sp.]|nr:ribonuclease HII [Leptospira sp.]